MAIMAPSMAVAAYRDAQPRNRQRLIRIGGVAA
jgi:hypothetical protein